MYYKLFELIVISVVMVIISLKEKCERWQTVTLSKSNIIFLVIHIKNLQLSLKTFKQYIYV